MNAGQRSAVVSSLSRRHDRVGQAVIDANTDGIQKPAMVLASTMITGYFFGPVVGAVPFVLYIGPKIVPMSAIRAGLSGLGDAVTGFGAAASDVVTGMVGRLPWVGRVMPSKPKWPSK